MLSFRSKGAVPPLYWLGSLALIALGDYFTGPFIHSAILFYLLPVALSAWGSRSRWPSLAVALIWPLLRLGIVAEWGWPWPLTLTIEDTIVNGIVSVGFATLVWQLRSQGRAIRTLEGLLPMCALLQPNPHGPGMAAGGRLSPRPLGRAGQPYLLPRVWSDPLRAPRR